MGKHQLEAGELFKGPCGVLSESPWLTAETLPPNRDTVVTIEAVIRRANVTFERGGRTEKKTGYGSLRFAGKDRELGLNATNRKILSALFGADTSAWYGKKIALYVDPNVSAFGQVVPAVRIRARRIDATTPDSAPTEEKKADPPLQ